MKTIAKIAFTLVIALIGLDLVAAQDRRLTPKPTPLTLSFQPNPGVLHEVTTEWVETEPDSRTNLSFGSQLFSIPTAVGETITARTVGSLWRVLDRDQNGNAVIEITYTYVRSARTFGRTVDAWANFIVKNQGLVVRWDTRHTTTEINPDFDGLEPTNDVAKFFVKYLHDIETARQALASYLINRPFRIVVDKQGHVIDIKDMDLLLDQYRTELSKLTSDLGTRAKTDAIVTAFLGEDAVRQSLTATQLLPFPATPVNVGQKWSDSYEFTVLGNKVPVSREFSVVQSFPESYELAGKTTATIKKRADEKDVYVTLTAEASTNLDPKTGMFYELKQKGAFRRQQAAGSNADSMFPQNDVLMRYDETTKFSSIAERSPNDRSKWRFYGGYEDFVIWLGEHWYREEGRPDDPFSSTFVDAQNRTRINSMILWKGHLPILQSKDDIPAYLEEYSKPTFPVKSFSFNKLKTFRTGSVEWYRAAVEIKYETDAVEHLIVQAGFDGTKFFVFFLSASGDDFERKLAEGTTALDSIEIRAR